ncbi:hypothetical protein DY000_02059129 [Brassica cretica]|uniref:Uncharacterized protein n=1 Tax=Brassica cretica TaxID=69181 RepID=A0ABQ7AZP6_BRACR|nr:hypothetical protein DY000_02059129 [Brassica cretica]
MSLLSIGIPHGVPGDIWVHLELKGGDYSDLWTSTAWSDFPERLHEVAVTHIPERPGQSDIERTGSTFTHTTTFVLGALKTPNIIHVNDVMHA